MHILTRERYRNWISWYLDVSPSWCQHFQYLGFLTGAVVVFSYNVKGFKPTWRDIVGLFKEDDSDQRFVKNKLSRKKSCLIGRQFLQPFHFCFLLFVCFAIQICSWCSCISIKEMVEVCHDFFLFQKGKKKPRTQITLLSNVKWSHLCGTQRLGGNGTQRGTPPP